MRQQYSLISTRPHPNDHSAASSQNPRLPLSPPTERSSLFQHRYHSQLPPQPHSSHDSARTATSHPLSSYASTGDDVAVPPRLLLHLLAAAALFLPSSPSPAVAVTHVAIPIALPSPLLSSPLLSLPSLLPTSQVRREQHRKSLGANRGPPFIPLLLSSPAPARHPL
ncbi:hypothetical protein GW17_00032127 [Ensete ventricosum]|nr:hypothetical protein GW17_00032127 [Ensete ventricosum]RZR83278.1 hypothetical protein BHM03_00009865 [Ensete ventricosum]